MLCGVGVAPCLLHRYERVRQLLLDGGLQLPDSPRVQAGAAVKLAPSGAVDSSEVDPGVLCLGRVT